MFLGLRTVVYVVDDLTAATAWYANATGVAPYFTEPFYVGFNVAGYELGLAPAEGAAVARGTNAVAYWGVTDVSTAVARLQSLGATVHEPAHDVGGGIVVATVVDPFGNAFGVIHNPHFKLPDA